MGNTPGDGAKVGGILLVGVIVATLIAVTQLNAKKDPLPEPRPTPSPSASARR